MQCNFVAKVKYETIDDDNFYGNYNPSFWNSCLVYIQ